MGKQYSHLTFLDRQIIDKLLLQGRSKAFIAEHLGVSLSTIYRELQRNNRVNARNGKFYYSSWIAQRFYIRRRQRPSKLNQDKALRDIVYKKLRSGWSPWQIEWHIRYEVPDLQNITHETIYRHIYGHWTRRNEFTPHLRRKRLARIKHGSRKKREMDKYPLSYRPEAVNKREIFGHWECDLMVFKKGMKGNLITLTERQSRYSISIKNPDRKSHPTAFGIITALKKIKSYVHSITFDQGTEFSQFELIKDCLETKIYFCAPASPHEKGGIENRNGVIRTVYPRNHDIMKTPQKEIDSVIASINERPMLCLNYRSPKKLFQYAIAGAPM